MKKNKTTKHNQLLYLYLFCKEINELFTKLNAWSECAVDCFKSEDLGVDGRDSRDMSLLISKKEYWDRISRNRYLFSDVQDTGVSFANDSARSRLF